MNDDRKIIVYEDDISLNLCSLDYTGDDCELNFFLSEPSIIECNIELNKRAI